jgi:hypothetical protein
MQHRRFAEDRSRDRLRRTARRIITRGGVAVIGPDDMGDDDTYWIEIP